MNDSAVRYDQDALWITRGGQTSRIAGDAISAVVECHMQDEIVHADEYCHIIRMQDAFWLIGPFVAGAAHAIHALRRDHPERPLERMKLLRVPWRMRAPGLFGWRMWPIAGLGLYPNTRLTELTRTEAHAIPCK